MIGAGHLPSDADGTKSQLVNTNGWTKKRFTIAASAWTLIDFGAVKYSSILLQNTGSSDIILSDTDSSDTALASNSPADAGYGVELKAGTEKPWQFTENLKIYARVKTGGADCKLTVAVGW